MDSRAKLKPAPRMRRGALTGERQGRNPAASRRNRPAMGRGLLLFFTKYEKRRDGENCRGKFVDEEADSRARASERGASGRRE